MSTCINVMDSCFDFEGLKRVVERLAVEVVTEVNGIPVRFVERKGYADLVMTAANWAEHVSSYARIYQDQTTSQIAFCRENLKANDPAHLKFLESKLKKMNRLMTKLNSKVCDNMRSASQTLDTIF